MFKNETGDKLEFEGRVTKCLPGTKFIVELDANNHQIECTISGRMRKNYIRLVPGDKVTVAMTLYDLTKGRIVYRQSASRSPAGYRRRR